MKHFNKDQIIKNNVLHLKVFAKQLHLKSIQHCKKNRKNIDQTSAEYNLCKFGHKEKRFYICFNLI